MAEIWIFVSHVVIGITVLMLGIAGVASTESSILSTILVLSIASTSVLLFAVVVLKYRNELQLLYIGTQHGYMKWAIPCIIMIATFSLQFHAEGESDYQEGAEGLTNKHALFVVILFLVNSLFIAPFYEEVFYRHFLYVGLSKLVNRCFSILVCSAAFALSHMRDITETCALFLVAIVLSLVRDKSGLIFPCIFLHSLYNGIILFHSGITL